MLLESGSEEQTIKLWNIRDGKCLRTLPGHTNRIRSVAFIPDGQTIAIGAEDQTVKVSGAKLYKDTLIESGQSLLVLMVCYLPVVAKIKP